LQKKIKNITHFYIIDQIGITGKGTEYVLRGHKGARGHEGAKGVIEGAIKGPMTHITAVTQKGIIGQMPQQGALMAQRKQSFQTTHKGLANGSNDDQRGS